MGLSIALLVPMYVEAVNIALFACLFLLNGQAKTAVKLLLFFGVLAALSYVPQNTGAFAGVVLPVSFNERTGKTKTAAKFGYHAFGDVPFFSDAR